MVILNICLVRFILRHHIIWYCVDLSIVCCVCCVCCVCVCELCVVYCVLCIVLCVLCIVLCALCHVVSCCIVLSHLLVEALDDEKVRLELGGADLQVHKGKGGR